MTYRQVLLSRWSRRDRLAVLLVAVTVAFLTGTTLVVVAMGAQTTAIAAEYDTGGAITYHQSLGAATAATGSGGIAVPVAHAEVNGSTVTVAGPPRATWNGVPLAAAPGATHGTIDEPENVTFHGDATVTTTVTPRDRTIFPPNWYVTDAETVRQLGVDGAFAVSPGDTIPASGVPLRGALAFFVAGTREALAAFTIAAGVGGILVAVTAYSITQLTITARLPTVRVARATGATPAQIRRLFVTRTLVLLGVGVAAGYAIGVVATNALVTAAIAVGLPTSLSIDVSSAAVEILGPLYAGLLGVGALAALVAARSASAVPPGKLGERSHRESLLPGPMAPRLLDARAVVPTAATLAAFVVFVLLVAGLGGVVGPLASPESATVTEPGATHPIASTVPAEYADALTARGIAASPEILLFAVRNGQPYPARGANFSAFAAVSGARLVAGHEPRSPDEAVIGRDLAQTLDVSRGDTMTLGGSTHAAVTRVRVVGTFDGAGPTDDQLLVPLDTARHLAGKRGSSVHFIRAGRLPVTNTTAGGGTVLDLTHDETVAAGSDFTVTVRVRNDGLSRQTVSRTVEFAGSSQTVRTSVPPAGERTVQASFVAPAPGNYTVRVGDLRRSVTVRSPDAVRFVGLPDRAPLGSEPLVRVETVAGSPAANTAVRVADRMVTTDASGHVRLPLETTGATTVAVTRGNRSDSAIVHVTGDAQRSVSATVGLSPARPNVFTRPDLTVTLANPWNRTLRESLTIAAPGGPYRHTVTLAPGDQTSIRHTLPRRPPGSYSVSVTANKTLATTSYTVTGDDRIVSSLAAGGRQGSTGIGRAIQMAFGNVQVALGALLVLGGLVAVSGTTSSFAGAVHARRRTVGIARATGADPLAVIRVIVGDALRIGSLAALVALVGGFATLSLLGATGLLVVYGVRVPIVTDPELLLAIGVAAVCLTAVGAGVAALGLVRVAPSRLLADDGRLESKRGGGRD